MICHPITYVFPRNNIDYIEIGYLKIVYQNGSWIQVVPSGRLIFRHCEQTSYQL